MMLKRNLSASFPCCTDLPVGTLRSNHWPWEEKEPASFVLKSFEIPGASSPGVLLDSKRYTNPTRLTPLTRRQTQKDGSTAEVEVGCRGLLEKSPARAIVNASTLPNTSCELAIISVINLLRQGRSPSLQRREFESTSKVKKSRLSREFSRRCTR